MLNSTKSKLLAFWNWIKHKENIALLANIATVIAFFLLLKQIGDGNEQARLVKEQLSFLSEHTKLLRNQVFVANSLSIFKLGDRCMWSTPHGGDYDSYLLLKAMKADPINKEMIKAIDNQIKRVEDRYRSTDVMIDYASGLQAIMKSGSRELADLDTVSVNNIFDHMKRYLPTEQIKAAYFMSGVTTKRLQESNKTWEDVFEILAYALSNDSWCLYGRKMALITYCKLAEIEFPEVFDFEKAVKDWKKRRKEILKGKNNS